MRTTLQRLALGLGATAVVASSTAVTTPAEAHRADDLHAAQRLQLTVPFASPVLNELTTIPVAHGRSLQYGNVALHGTTSVRGTETGVDVIAAAEYTDGSGPFVGSLTFGAATADQLALRIHGRAHRNADGSTDVRATGQVISAAGRWSGLTGTATIHGHRDAGVVLGGRVVWTVDLDLHAGAAYAPHPVTRVHQLRRWTDRVQSEVVTVPGTAFLLSGPGGRQWGLTHKEGPGVLDGVPVVVDDGVQTDYLGGGGTYTGYVTFRAEDGSLLATRYHGGTTAHPDGSATVQARLEVLGGTGRWAHARGRGTASGTRAAAVGSDLRLDIRLALAGH